MIAQRGFVIVDSLRARFMMGASIGALLGGSPLAWLQVFDHRRLSADMAAANWHTRTGLK